MSTAVVHIEDLLRSININYDIDKPDRIAHFQPTSKSLALLRSLLGLSSEKNFFVAAPYGTGKSISHSFITQIVENIKSSGAILSKINEKINHLDPELSHVIKKRIQSDEKGLVLLFQGYVENVPLAIRESVIASFKRTGCYDTHAEFIETLDFSNLKKALQSIYTLIKNSGHIGFNRVLFVWDEFGRHIETLIAEGRPAELNTLQVLAEFVSRTQTIPFTFSLLLHQSLMNYAGKVPHSVKKEWRKVEGRFETIQYVDDSKEIYQLIASVIQQVRNTSILITEEDLENKAKEYLSLGILKDFDSTSLATLIRNSFPVDPIALYMLPRISSRIAQHERTLFTFLNNLSPKIYTNLADVYDYFSTTMSSDTSIGGTYHQWLEAESAISKVDDENEIKVIKCACLLGIGITGQRQRASLDLLKHAVAGVLDNTDEATKIINSLIERKLLLYRKNSNSVAIWHGTDIDLIGKLQEVKDRMVTDFDAIELLRKLIEPKHWKSVEYNNRFRVSRFFRGEYLSCSGLVELLEKGLDRSLRYTEANKNTSYFEDGRIFYLIPENDDEHKTMRTLLESEQACHNQIIFVLPKHVLDIHDYALEVAAFHQLQEDSSILEEDPLILPELQQLTDDATDYLQRIVALATMPQAKGPLFIHKQEYYQFEDSKHLRTFLTIMMSIAFPLSPILNNEMINRRIVRSNLVNARKKLTLSILEQAGEPDLKLEGFTPNVSFFRSILKNTGLYVPLNDDASSWHFVLPEAISDKGLQAVWKKFQDFFTIEKKRTSFSSFYNELKKPPYGVRDGVLPILTAAAMRAFPSALVITDKQNKYLSDILASDLEDFREKEDAYYITVKALTDDRIKYLNGVIQIFDPNNTVSIREKDLIRRAYDSIELWKAQLSESSLYSHNITSDSKAFQELMRKTIEPNQLLLENIPTKLLLSGDNPSIELVLHRLAIAKNEMDRIPEAYFDSACTALLSALQLKEKTNNPAIDNARTWLGYFDEEIVIGIGGTYTAFIKRISNPYEDDRALLNSISSLLLGKDIIDWEDSDVIAFEKKVAETVHHIEDVVMNSDIDSKWNDQIKLKLAHLAVNRISHLRDKLVKLVGHDKAKSLIEKL